MAKSGWSEWRPTRFALQVEDDLGVMFKDLAEKLSRDVIYGSPIDTSSFLANNNFSVNSPDESYDASRRDPTRTQTLANARLAMAALKPGDTFHIVNTAPYGRKLEYGHSKQAPLGVYGVAVNNAKERVS